MYSSCTLISSTVTLPNNSTTHVTHTGSIVLAPDFILDNVLCVPTFYFNLISISALTNDIHCSVSFSSDSCHVQVLTKGRVIATGKRIVNLYILDTSSLYPAACNVSLTQHKLWHYRMGYPSSLRLAVIGKHLNLDAIKHDELIDCSICHVSKQKRLSFLSNNLIGDANFDLLHIDIWGHFIH